MVFLIVYSYSDSPPSSTSILRPTRGARLNLSHPFSGLTESGLQHSVLFHALVLFREQFSLPGQFFSIMPLNLSIWRASTHPLMTNLTVSSSSRRLQKAPDSSAHEVKSELECGECWGPHVCLWGSCYLAPGKRCPLGLWTLCG